MQRFLTSLVVATIIVALPLSALADNQETANQIAENLRDSGQLKDYKIGVKYQNGTAWLSGQVSGQQQMNNALKQVFQTAGVTRVVNNLTVGPAKKDGMPQPDGMVRFGRVSGSEQAAAAQLEPSRGALAPERINAGEQFRRVLTGNSHKQKQPTLATQLEATSRADRLPSSFTAAPVRQAALTAPGVEAPVATVARMPGRPIPIAYTQAGGPAAAQGAMGGPIPAYVAGVGGGVAPVRYDQANLPNHAWPSYAAYPNYGALTYPRQYSPTAWPFIGPFYPYPQVPMGWRKVTLEWDDGWWMLDFKDR